MLEIVPVTIGDAKIHVGRFHRHHRPPVSGLFAVGLARDDLIVGVAIVGRPVARMLQDGWTAEVTRCCVEEGVPNGCSKLYAACWRAARAIGYRTLITYTLADETGVSLSAAGWKVVHKVRGRSWSRPSRPRVDAHPTSDKTLWEIN